MGVATNETYRDTNANDKFCIVSAFSPLRLWMKHNILYKTTEK